MSVLLTMVYRIVDTNYFSRFHLNSEKTVFSLLSGRGTNLQPHTVDTYAAMKVTESSVVNSAEIHSSLRNFFVRSILKHSESHTNNHNLITRS